MLFWTFCHFLMFYFITLIPGIIMITTHLFQSQQFCWQSIWLLIEQCQNIYFHISSSSYYSIATILSYNRISEHFCYHIIVCHHQHMSASTHHSWTNHWSSLVYFFCILNNIFTSWRLIEYFFVILYGDKVDK